MAKPARRPGNLPAETTSFIGRRRKLAEVRKKLAAARLVSLVGPGGVGKTRLAIRAASELGRSFSGGAWLVELADVRDPALVGNVVMTALDLRDQAATEPQALLLAYLRDKDLLLVRRTWIGDLLHQASTWLPCRRWRGTLRPRRWGGTIAAIERCSAEPQPLSVSLTPLLRMTLPKVGVPKPRSWRTLGRRKRRNHP
jgi:hypothetical protein